MDLPLWTLDDDGGPTPGKGLWERLAEWWSRPSVAPDLALIQGWGG